MKMEMEVFARTRFVAFHQWKDAPEKYKYLASPHRHEFHIEVGVHVDLSNREVEFHELRQQLDLFCQRNWEHSMQTYAFGPKPIEASCEVMASTIAGYLRGECSYRITYVEVSEDGECGGRVKYHV